MGRFNVEKNSTKCVEKKKGSFFNLFNLFPPQNLSPLSIPGLITFPENFTLFTHWPIFINANQTDSLIKNFQSVLEFDAEHLNDDPTPQRNIWLKARMNQNNNDIGRRAVQQSLYR